MTSKDTVVVLVGSETAGRPWVEYEIDKAVELGIPLLGVCIHGLSDFGKTDSAGKDPFVTVRANGLNVPLFDPTVTSWGTIDSKATYSALTSTLESWAGSGVKER